MAVTTTNVVIGAAWGYTAAADTAEPSSAPATGGAITGYTQWGATEEGVALGLEREITNHFVEEVAIQIFSTPGTSTFSISTQLAESTLANWKLASGGGTVAGSVLTLADTLDTYAVYLDMEAPGATTRRTVYIPRAQSVGSLDVQNRRSEQKQLLGLTLNSSCTFAEIKITDKSGGS
jgi:hypothetical protein